MLKKTSFNRLFTTKNIEVTSFILVLLSIIFPLFCVDYLVTGDGPCHFYNSRILNDWHFKHQADFYKPFYQLNYFIDPNWISNVIQIPLINIFSVIWAEKIFFISYLLAFSLGFRRLIHTINPNATFLSSIGLLFAWNHILMMGFTNNAWSFAFWFWILAIWIASLQSESPQKNIILLLLFLLIYLSHPVGMMLSFISIACVTFFWGIYTSGTVIKAFQFYRLQFYKLILVAAPAIISFAHFFLRREWASAPKKEFSIDEFLQIFKLNSLINVTSRERDIVFGIAIFIIVLLSYAVFIRVFERKVKIQDGLFVLLCCLLYIVINPPSSFSGGLEIGIRLGILPYIGMLLWIATADFPKWIKYATPLVVFIFSILLHIERIPVLINASNYATEVISTKDYIHDKSKLLVLNYDWNGRTADNKEIANKIWLFGHIDCYLGLYKQLIISDNYEANYWYFPLIERWETNMYKKTSYENINFDNRPPRANFLDYEKNTQGQKIDYVLMLCYRDEFSQHPYTKEIFHQLDSAYTQVFKSNNARAILYKLK